MQCPAVQSMMEEDRWWEKMPPAGSIIEREKTIMKKFKCRCHGNALRAAIASGRPEFVSYILGTGYFDVNKSDLWGRSALFDAASLGSTEITKMLIRYGAKVNIDPAQSSWFNSPFNEACVRGHNRVVELLLRHKVYAHEFPNCLQHACRNRKVGVVAALLRWRRQGSSCFGTC